MAKGSHKTWGGWETRHCHTCQRRITLHKDTATHHYENGVAFSLCSEHTHLYAQVRAELFAANPDQLTLEVSP